MYRQLVPFLWLAVSLVFAGCNQPADNSAQIQTLNDKIRGLEQREQELKLQGERDKLDAERAALNAERQSLEAQKAGLASGPPVNRPVLLTAASSNGHSARHARYSDPDDSDAGSSDVDDDQPPPSEASYDIFYEDLQEGGHWFDDATYGYVWQPDVAADDPDWRPYTDGHWVYTDRGWTWVSNESFGWACYHYGRWARLRERGWIWVPGDQWAPAWVSWRQSDDDDYVGWAPLPPECEPRSGVRVQGWVDQYYDIGPAAYVFLKIADLVRPSYRQAVLPPQQNVTFIERTKNITDIYYNNQSVNVVGPRYEQVLQRVNHPIPKYQIDYVTPPQPNAPFHTAVAGNRLQVVAPPSRLAPRATVTPPAPQPIRNATVERGWQNVDPDHARQIRQALARSEPQVPKSLPPQPVPPRKPMIAAGRTPASPPAANDAAAQRARLEAERARLEQQKQALEQRGQPPPAAPAHQPPQPAPALAPHSPAPAAASRQAQEREVRPGPTEPQRLQAQNPQGPNAQEEAAQRQAEQQRAQQEAARRQAAQQQQQQQQQAAEQQRAQQLNAQRQQQEAAQREAEQQRQQQQAAARQHELEVQKQQQLKAQQEAAQRQQQAAQHQAAEQQRAQQEAAQRQAQQQAAQAAAQQQEAQRHAQAEAAQAAAERQAQAVAQQHAAEAAAQRQAQAAAGAHQQQAQKAQAEKAAAEKAAAEQRAKGQAPSPAQHPQ